MICLFSPIILKYLCIDADDTTLYTNMETFSAETLELDINNNLESLNRWFQINKLSLNASRTKLVIFRKKKANTDPKNIHEQY